LLRDYPKDKLTILPCQEKQKADAAGMTRNLREKKNEDFQHHHLALDKQDLLRMFTDIMP